MLEKGILYLRPPFPIDEPDPAMEALLKRYAEAPELPMLDDKGRPLATEADEGSYEASLLVLGPPCYLGTGAWFSVPMPSSCVCSRGAIAASLKY